MIGATPRLQSQVVRTDNAISSPSKVPNPMADVEHHMQRAAAAEFRAQEAMTTANITAANLAFLQAQNVELWNLCRWQRAHMLALEDKWKENYNALSGDLHATLMNTGCDGLTDVESDLLIQFVAHEPCVAVSDEDVNAVFSGAQDTLLQIHLHHF